MIGFLALRAVLFATLAGVQGLTVVSAGDQTQVVIEANGQVTYQHGLLTNPPRIVVDVSGAAFQLPQQRFLDINRGGVLGLRSSQFQPGVVRVVIDLAQAVDYRVEQTGGAIVVSFRNPSGVAFEPWRSSGARGEAVPQYADAEPIGQPIAAQPPEPRPVERVPDQAARPVAPPAPVRQVEQPAAPVIQAQRQPEPAIWVEFRNTPITDVLGTFADFSGRSIVPGQGVAAQAITAAIQGQPWDEAMRAILAGQGLIATELPSGIIMVTSLQHQRVTETQEATVTRAFPLRYMSADSVAPQVRQLLAEGEGPAIGTVAVNKATNTLIISSRQSVVDRLEALLPVLDRRTPQVTVKVRIMNVSRTRARALGFRYELVDRHPDAHTRIGPNTLFEFPRQVNLAGNTIAAIGNAAVQPADEPTFTAVASLILGRHTLVSFIEAAQSIELAELQADPIISVLDHRTARIHVGQRTPIRVVDPGAAGAQGPQAQVRIEETGVILEITPHVVGDQILLNLHAERSFIETQTADGQFVFGTAETTTQILVDDGATAVISGLTTTDMRRTMTGIPILMNIPVFGALFRFEEVQQEQSDLLIMVTPHIERMPAI
jgi:type II secretory pathway component GspD/PulD (secretin)